VKDLNRKTRFWLGFLLVVFLYSLPIAGLVYAKLTWYLIFFIAGFVFSVYLVYRTTIKNIKPKYPLVNPEGHPDIYSGRMPRPIYEDMEQYPWFFNRKKNMKKFEKNKKVKKRH